MKNSSYGKIYEKKCDVCNKILLASKTGNGACPYCGWYNNRLGEINEYDVIFPNLISFNKAKNLHKEGKPFKPDLNDFLDGFAFYGEMQFIYKNIDCELIRSNNEGGISFCYEEGNEILFENKEDFIKNAKIENEYVRDIWDLVEKPKYM